MEDRVREALRGSRLYLGLAVGAAIVAMLLAAIGIYALLSHTFEQRMQEFGVRLALGASRISILGLALAQAIGLGSVGTAIGLGLALVLSRLLGDSLFLVQGKHDGMLYGVTLTDPLTLTAASVTLLIVATLSGVGPARRATGVDPVVALRAD
jgi:ABC-type antimicrobial peptide transport system permease subunit